MFTSFQKRKPGSKLQHKHSGDGLHAYSELQQPPGSEPPARNRNGAGGGTGDYAASAAASKRDSGPVGEAALADTPRAVHGGRPGLGESRKRGHGGDGERGGEAPAQLEHVSVDFRAVQPAQRDPFTPAPRRSKPLEIGSLWGLTVLALAYVHHSTTGFALPALLPAISQDLSLTDSQGAALTAGYTFLYAIALVPMGLLADRADRPRLLAGGLVAWSALTVLAARTHSFGELLFTRIGFAVAQATQNPICFSLIPELFPNTRTTAMAFYNAAIYMGRALSFAVALLANNLGVLGGGGGAAGAAAATANTQPVIMVPLDKLDLSHVSILYTAGDMAAIVPIYDYRVNLASAAGAAAAGEGWRHWLQWLGPPGLLIAALCLLTVDEPRAERGFLGDPMASSKFINATTRRFARSPTDAFVSGGREAGDKGGAVGLPKKAPPAARTLAESVRQLRELVTTRPFQAVTLAATLNDVGSWALVSWHATFYARCYGLPPETYAPLLAVVVPVGGLLGGVGGGLMGDWLQRIGGRQWLTAGACLGAAPFVTASILLPDYRLSFAALLVGFALAEAWRAPAAIIVRDVSPPGLGSTAVSVHLCIRNIIGGLGPLGVALLADMFDLRAAMLLVPLCFALSGAAFYATERVIASPQAQPPA